LLTTDSDATETGTDNHNGDASLHKAGERERVREREGCYGPVPLDTSFIKKAGRRVLSEQPANVVKGMFNRKGANFNSGKPLPFTTFIRSPRLLQARSCDRAKKQGTSGPWT